MAKGIKSGGRNFKPGQSGNPNGRPPLPKEFRDFRNAAKKDIIEEIKYLWSLSEEELKEIAPKKVNKTDENGIEVEEEEIESNAPALRKALAKAILRAISTGSMFDIDRILDRVIGRVKEEVEVNHAGSFHHQIVQVIKDINIKNSEKEVSSAKEDSSENSEEE